MRTLALFAFLIVPAFASGQNRANFPWWNSPVTQDLGLNAEQSQKIHEIVRSYRDRLLDARNNALKAEGELEDVLNSPKVEQGQAKKVIDRVASARANSSHVFLEMSLKLRGVLTLDQWRQLVRRWDEMQRKKPSDTQVEP